MREEIAVHVPGMTTLLRLNRDQLAHEELGDALELVEASEDLLVDLPDLAANSMPMPLGVEHRGRAILTLDDKGVRLNGRGEVEELRPLELCEIGANHGRAALRWDELAQRPVHEHLHSYPPWPSGRLPQLVKNIYFCK